MYNDMDISHFFLNELKILHHIYMITYNNK